MLTRGEGGGGRGEGGEEEEKGRVSELKRFFAAANDDIDLSRDTTGNQSLSRSRTCRWGDMIFQPHPLKTTL